MALRKFVFINATEGFSQEQGASDELSLGKATFLGVEGVAIDASEASIINVAAGVAANDAVNKGQLEAVEADYAAADAAVTAAFEAADSLLSGRLDIIEGDDTTEGSVAKAEKDAKDYTDARELLIRSDFASADATTLASAQSYADSLLAGFVVKSPVKAASTTSLTLSGEQTVDGVALVAGDRVLVKNQTDAKQNGIYVVAAGVWARSADANSDAEVKDGLSVFVEQGTENADDTFVLITNNAITLGTSELDFVKFSGLGQISAGDGLSKIADTLSVNVGDGIAIVSDAVAIDLATDPGLQFTSNKLDLKLDADGGLSKDSAGLKVISANADNLSVTSAGIDVVGVPSLFKIDGTAVSADVTAANLNDLTDGGDTTLHNHASVSELMVASEAFNAGCAVVVSSSNKIAKGSSGTIDNSGARVIGVAVQESSGDGSNVRVIKHGLASNMFVGGPATQIWPGTPLYLSEYGTVALFSEIPSGQRIIRLGFARNTSGDLEVMIQDMGQKA